MRCQRSKPTSQVPSGRRVMDSASAARPRGSGRPAPSRSGPAAIGSSRCAMPAFSSMRACAQRPRSSTMVATRSSSRWMPERLAAPSRAASISKPPRLRSGPSSGEGGRRAPASFAAWARLSHAGEQHAGAEHAPARQARRGRHGSGHHGARCAGGHVTWRRGHAAASGASTADEPTRAQARAASCSERAAAHHTSTGPRSAAARCQASAASSSNSSASFFIIVPPSSSASTMVTARR